MSNLAICFFYSFAIPIFLFWSRNRYWEGGLYEIFCRVVYPHPALRDTEQYAQKSVCGTAATGTGQTRPVRTHQPAFALPNCEKSVDK